MALATCCPHCETAFRVASDQLKLRAGLVRCGTCSQIFNGIEHLVHADEETPPAVAVSARLSAEVLPSNTTSLAGIELEQEPASPDDNLSSHSNAEADWCGPTADLTDAASKAADESNAAGGSAGLQPVGWFIPGDDIKEAPMGGAGMHAVDGAPRSDVAPDGEPLRRAPADEPLHPPPAPADPCSDANLVPQSSNSVVVAHDAVHEGADRDENELDRTAVDIPQLRPIGVGGSVDTIPSMAGLLRAARVDGDGVLARPPGMLAPPPKAKPTGEVKQAPESSDLPDFVMRENRKRGAQRALRPLLWMACGLLGLVLIGQSIYAARTTLAANFPQTRAVLEMACRWIGCEVGLPMQIESVSIESSDFQPVTGNREMFLLTVLLRNRGSTVQDWPAIELTLSDAADKTVGRRVIAPPEYLPTGQSVSTGFTAGSEQAVKLYFALAQLNALGYRVYLFYP